MPVTIIGKDASSSSGISSALTSHTEFVHKILPMLSLGGLLAMWAYRSCRRLVVSSFI